MASGCRLARGVRLYFGQLQRNTACLCHKNSSTLGKQQYRNLSYSNHLRIVTSHRAPSILGNSLSFGKLGHVQNKNFSTEIRDPDYTSVDPFKLIEDDLATLCGDIRKELSASEVQLEHISRYHFDGHGKAFRPLIVMLTAKACNLHHMDNRDLLSGQRKIALITEMIHTASLIHDDVIDASETRRGKESVQQAWGQKKAILTGDYILSVSSQLLARVRNDEVVQVLSQVLEDLVRGEFMQLGSKEDENERFNHYLRKTYKKTASLVANSCKSVAILADCDPEIVEAAFQYGKNTGIAFQLVDDLLDYTSCDSVMGKPTAADLKLGLATAPVLYAAHQYSDLNSMIMRRFSEPNDVERARELVAKSDGIEHTKYLAEQHCKEAIKQINMLNQSAERDALKALTHKVLTRSK